MSTQISRVELQSLTLKTELASAGIGFIPQGSSRTPPQIRVALAAFEIICVGPTQSQTLTIRVELGDDDAGAVEAAKASFHAFSLALVEASRPWAASKPQD